MPAVTDLSQGIVVCTQAAEYVSCVASHAAQYIFLYCSERDQQHQWQHLSFAQ